MSRPRPPGVELRPWRPTDREFLVGLYATTRAEELEASRWPPAQREAFARAQFDLQEQHYGRQFPLAERSLIMVGPQRAGRLIVDRRGDEIGVIDISIMPEDRGRGIGSALIKAVLAEGRDTGRPVRLHVVSSNPARRLYERLGFVRVGTSGRPPETRVAPEARRTAVLRESRRWAHCPIKPQLRRDASSGSALGKTHLAARNVVARFFEPAVSALRAIWRARHRLASGW